MQKTGGFKRFLLPLGILGCIIAGTVVYDNPMFQFYFFGPKTQQESVPSLPDHRDVFKKDKE